MRCLIDAQLPPALARWLTAEGHDASHVIVWVRYGNVRKAELLRKLTAVWPEVADAIARGESLIELA